MNASQRLHMIPFLTSDWSVLASVATGNVSFERLHWVGGMTFVLQRHANHAAITGCTKLTFKEITEVKICVFFQACH